ncbi:SDR family NAD(P)-dependent oxidoreductase [Jatrophihabitans sp. DSM 44399]|uniref:SDR family NAD(P)-dependent oxidoreductase n=1 Tax=Jatrophihabitans lederbergiae TaxID=3075547 RepID=A0ABU2JED3_9ACTN|nr:SDR family NAD(P)-dependent oxidoreductase [Jatrophihabitans sp. DSM 44399]MDT0263340.1 SDR family NAD(P)-dependent oxidoreductase [Jatrophihabitans sp. DSM 44399]
MGATHVRALVAQGAYVVLGDVRDEQGEALAAELGPAARYVHLDVTDEQQWAAADFRLTLEINLVGQFLGMAAVLPVMRAQGRGSVINISSIAGLAAGYGPPAYTASKWGIRGLTKTAALEMAGTGVRVNSVHPGIIKTPLSAHLTDEATAHQVIPRQGEQRGR